MVIRTEVEAMTMEVMTEVTSDKLVTGAASCQRGEPGSVPWTTSEILPGFRVAVHNSYDSRACIRIRLLLNDVYFAMLRLEVFAELTVSEQTTDDV
jgi:hypothetical protein